VTTHDAVAGAPDGAGNRFISRAPKLGFIAPLDGLRGIAIILVVFAHASYEGFASFVGGVDIFFAVSGFLITTLILQEDRSQGGVDLRAFYIRRALRLLPLLFLVLAATLLGALIIGHPEFLESTWNGVWPGATYLSHVVHPVHTEVVTGGAPIEQPLIQLWSLSVEEHFYVFGVIAIMLAIKRQWAKYLVAALLGAWVFMGMARLAGHVGPDFMWWQRPDSIFLGVVLAFANSQLPEPISPKVDRTLRVAAPIAIAVQAVVLMLSSSIIKPLGIYVPFSPEKGGSLNDGLYWGKFGFSILSICTCIIILYAVRIPNTRVARTLSVAPLLAIGRRSYAIYLIHVPLFLVMREGLGNKLGDGAVLLLYLPALVISTEVAHRLVERPIAKIRTRYNPPSAPTVPAS